MKKSIAILLALMLSFSILAACGSEEEPPTPVVDEPKTEATPEPTPEPAPTPELIPDGMTTVEITDADFGDIVFSYPDDGSVEVFIAEPGAEDDSLMADDDFRELLGVIIQSDNNVKFQRALLVGDDFNIIVGYTDFYNSASTYKTFGMAVRGKMDLRAEPVTLGGLDGIVNAQHVASFIFPAITQIASRMILVFPNSIDEGEDVREMSLSLIERADIQAILNTFSFPG